LYAVTPKKSKEKKGLVFPSGRRTHAANKTSKNTVPIPRGWLSINERQGSKAHSRGHPSLTGYCSAASPSFSQQPSNRVASRRIGFALTRQQLLPLSNPCNNRSTFISFVPEQW